LTQPAGGVTAQTLLVELKHSTTSSSVARTTAPKLPIGRTPKAETSSSTAGAIHESRPDERLRNLHEVIAGNAATPCDFVHGVDVVLFDRE
jgi:hypothetical protein